MSNVYYVGSEPLTFDSIELILTQNMKLELSQEVRERIQRCRDYLDPEKSNNRMVRFMALQPASARYAIKISRRRTEYLTGKPGEKPCL